jgi:hypothetical protein
LVTDGNDDPWALHRPGPRYLADTNARNPASAQLAKAYAEYDADQRERWRGNNKLECVPDQIDATPVMDARELAYAAYEQGNVGGLAQNRMTRVAKKFPPSHLKPDRAFLIILAPPDGGTAPALCGGSVQPGAQ